MEIEKVMGICASNADCEKCELYRKDIRSCCIGRWNPEDWDFDYLVKGVEEYEKNHRVLR